MTYPAHVSMMTGCYVGKHGVTSNFSFTTTNKDDNWLWFSDAIQVEDIFQAAKKPGIPRAPSPGLLPLGTRMWIG